MHILVESNKLDENKADLNKQENKSYSAVQDVNKVANFI